MLKKIMTLITFTCFLNVLMVQYSPVAFAGTHGSSSTAYAMTEHSNYDVAEAEMLRARAIASDNGYRKLVELSEQAHARLLNRQNAIAERKLQLLLGILS